MPENIIDWLREEFCARRKKNPQFSMRGYAKKLKVSPGALSEILAGKRAVSLETAERIADGLDFDYAKKTRFLELVKDARAPTQTAKRGAASAAFKQIDADIFAVIADWQHWAIMSLMKTDDFRNDAKWIAKLLGLNKIEVEAAIARLCRLGLVEIHGQDLRCTHASLTTTDNIPSAALRRSHKQSLDQAVEALEEVPVPLRDIRAVTFAVDLKQLPALKAKLKEFAREFALEAEDGEKKNAVYNLQLCLIPLTKTGVTHATDS